MSRPVVVLSSRSNENIHKIVRFDLQNAAWSLRHKTLRNNSSEKFRTLRFNAKLVRSVRDEKIHKTVFFRTNDNQNMAFLFIWTDYQQSRERTLYESSMIWPGHETCGVDTIIEESTSDARVAYFLYFTLLPNQSTRRSLPNESVDEESRIIITIIFMRWTFISGVCQRGNIESTLLNDCVCKYRVRLAWKGWNHPAMKRTSVECVFSCHSAAVAVLTYATPSQTFKLHRVFSFSNRLFVLIAFHSFFFYSSERHRLLCVLLRNS